MNGRFPKLRSTAMGRDETADWFTQGFDAKIIASRRDRRRHKLAAQGYYAICYSHMNIDEPKMPEIANSKNMKGALLQLTLALALLIIIRIFGVRLSDWRVTELCGWAALLLFPVSLIRLALALRSRLLRYGTMAAGIVLLPIVLFSNFGRLLESGRTGFIQDPWFIQEWQFGPAKYRFYYSDLGGMGQPATGQLKREWDTAYGVKFVQPVLDTVYWCCGIHLRQSKESVIEVFDQEAGTVSVLAEIDMRNGNVLVKDGR